MASEAPLELRDVSKSFSGVSVLRRVSLSFAADETVLLLGANGAGKSTLLRVAAGLTRPDSGKVQRAPGAIGFAAHQLLLYPRLTVLENLKLFSRIARAAKVHEIVDTWELGGIANKVVAELSRGNQARVSLARAFMSDPSIVLLDEPSSNLDDRGTNVLVSCLERMRRRRNGDLLTLLATHDVHRLGSLASRVVVLTHGEVSGDSGPAATSNVIADLIASYREGNR